MRNKFEGEAGQQNQITVLLQNPAVSDDNDIAEYIAANSKLLGLEKDEFLIRQNKEGNEVFFLLSGTVSIEPNNQVKITRSAPDTVGEMAALNPKRPRNADVRASTKTVFVLKMTDKNFQNLCKEHSVFKSRLEKIVSERLQDRMPLQSSEEKKIKRNFFEKHGLILGVILLSVIFLVSLFTFNQITATSPYRLALSTLITLVIGWLTFWGQPKLIYRKSIKQWIWFGIATKALDIGFEYLYENAKIKFHIFKNGQEETLFYIFFTIVLIVLIVAEHYDKKTNKF